MSGRVERRTFQNVPLGADGRTQPIQLELPQDVESVAIHVKGAKDAYYLVDEFEAPGGESITSSAPKGVVLSDEERAKNPYDLGQVKSPNRAMLGSYPGLADYIAPNGPQVSLEGGTAEFSVKGFSAQPGQVAGPDTRPVDIEVEIKRGELKRGRLPLHLYFTGANGYTAETARTSPIIQKALEKAKGLYETAGITLGPVTYRDVVAPTDFNDLSNTQKVWQLSQHEDGVGIFFVNRLPGITVGIAGALPGPAAGSEIPNGVVIGTHGMPLDFRNPDAAANQIGGTIAHELGHYLGLFHTEDDWLGVEDPFDDTSSDNRLNVMTPREFNEGSFSPSQAEQMRRHPAIEPLEPTAESADRNEVSQTAQAA